MVLLSLIITRNVDCLIDLTRLRFTYRIMNMIGISGLVKLSKHSIFNVERHSFYVLLSGKNILGSITYMVWPIKRSADGLQKTNLKSNELELHRKNCHVRKSPLAKNDNFLLTITLPPYDLKYSFQRLNFAFKKQFSQKLNGCTIFSYLLISIRNDFRTVVVSIGDFNAQMDKICEWQSAVCIIVTLQVGQKR